MIFRVIYMRGQYTDNIEGFIVLAGSRARFYVYKAILSLEIIGVRTPHKSY